MSGKLEKKRKNLQEAMLGEYRFHKKREREGGGRRYCPVS